MADDELVRKIAALAHLDVTDDEVEELGAQFRRILDAFETLTRAEVDAQGSDASAAMPLRADDERESLSTEDALANAPRVADGFFSVPKTIGRS